MDLALNNHKTQTNKPFAHSSVGSSINLPSTRTNRIRHKVNFLSGIYQV